MALSQNQSQKTRLASPTCPTFRGRSGPGWPLCLNQKQGRGQVRWRVATLSQVHYQCIIEHFVLVVFFSTFFPSWFQAVMTVRNQVKRSDLSATTKSVSLLPWEMKLNDFFGGEKTRWQGINIEQGTGRIESNFLDFYFTQTLTRFPFWPVSVWPQVATWPCSWPHVVSRLMIRQAC